MAPEALGNMFVYRVSIKAIRDNIIYIPGTHPAFWKSATRSLPIWICSQSPGPNLRHSAKVLCDPQKDLLVLSREEEDVTPIQSLYQIFQTLMNKPPPQNREYNRDPNVKALKRRGCINHGSTLFPSFPTNPPSKPKRSQGADPRTLNPYPNITPI